MNEAKTESKSVGKNESAQTKSDVLHIRDLTHSYRQGARRIDVLRGLNISLRRGDIAALVGPSGAGKSTLLHLAGLLERVQKGDIMIEGVALAGADDKTRTHFRCAHIGFVYQFHNLLPELTALENVTMPQRIAGVDARQAIAYAKDLLAQLGLAERAQHRPSELSGGEQQRVAIARALANQPALILADEPTGSLDPETGGRVFELLHRILQEQNAAALIATHNPILAERLPRRFRLENGALQEA